MPCINEELWLHEPQLSTRIICELPAPRQPPRLREGQKPACVSGPGDSPSVSLMQYEGERDGLTGGSGSGRKPSHRIKASGGTPARRWCTL